MQIENTAPPLPIMNFITWKNIKPDVTYLFNCWVGGGGVECKRHTVRTILRGLGEINYPFRYIVLYNTCALRFKRNIFKYKNYINFFFLLYSNFNYYFEGNIIFWIYLVQNQKMSLDKYKKIRFQLFCKYRFIYFKNDMYLIQYTI